MSIETNRIGDLCYYFPTMARDQLRVGYLRMWGTDFDEIRESVAPFPIGVIEDVITGKCESVCATRIYFKRPDVPDNPALDEALLLLTQENVL